MDIKFKLELDGYEIDFNEAFEAPDPVAHIKGRVEQFKTGGIKAYKRPSYGGRGNGNHAPEAWARATKVRVFTFSKDGENKKALEFGLEPEAGQFAVRSAMAWDTDAILAAMPPALKAAVEAGWSDTTKKGGTELALTSVALEVGFYKDGEKLKAVAIRMAGANGSTTDQKVVV